jgi:hypothetical protein
MKERKSQPLILGADKEPNQNQQVKKSTPHFGRVGYGKVCCVTSFNVEADGPPRPNLVHPSGFTSLTETFFVLFLIWFFASVI